MLGEDGGGSISCSTDPDAGAHRLGVACSNLVWDNGEVQAGGQEFFDTGFASWAACGSVFVHNTLYAPPQVGFSALEGRFTNSSTVIANNLATLGTRDRGGDTKLINNTANATETTFVEASAIDLRPAAATLPALDLSDRPLVVTHCPVDFEGSVRPRQRESGRDRIPLERSRPIRRAAEPDRVGDYGWTLDVAMRLQSTWPFSGASRDRSSSFVVKEFAESKSAETVCR